MTPAAIALAVLCGVLAVVAFLGVRATFVYHGGMMEAYKDLRASREEASDLRRDLAIYADGSDKDSQIIAEAHALLHDERHKGRLENQKAWQKARDEWSAKVKGVKA